MSRISEEVSNFAMEVADAYAARYYNCVGQNVTGIPVVVYNVKTHEFSTQSDASPLTDGDVVAMKLEPGCLGKIVLDGEDNCNVIRRRIMQYIKGNSDLWPEVLFRRK